MATNVLYDPVCDTLSPFWDDPSVPLVKSPIGQAIEKSIDNSKACTSTNPHPAEISGASKHSNSQLMGLPLELQNQIFRDILANELAIHQELSSHILPSTTLAPNRIHGLKYVSCTTVPSDSTHSAAIMQTCKAAYEEGRNMLLGNDQCFNTHMHLFKGLLRQFQKPGVCGPLAPFEAITLRLSKHTDFVPATILISRKMPHLQHLQITLLLEDASITWVSRDQAFQKCNGDTVNCLEISAVKFTRDHPTLKKAILSTKRRLLDEPGKMYGQHRGEVAVVLDLVPVSVTLESCQPVHWPVPIGESPAAVLRTWPSTHTILESV